MRQDLESSRGPEQLKESGEESPNPVGGSRHCQTLAELGAVPQRGNGHLIKSQFMKLTILKKLEKPGHPRRIGT